MNQLLCKDKSKLSHALLTCEQMAECDRMTVIAGISDISLMENAGHKVAQAIIERWNPCSVVVLCGPGNNGGDGFVIARILADANWSVRVASLVSRDQLKGSAVHHSILWQGVVEPLTPEALNGAELIVDAIFGAGLTRPLQGSSLETLLMAESKCIPIVAVDVPSGLMGDTGENVGAVAAELTVTFFRKKPGHLLQPGKSLCGELLVTDIGTPISVLFDDITNKVTVNSFENHPDLWIDAFPLLEQEGNKYNRGHALVWGGWPATGAARMSAKAAARVGAGLTTVAVDVSQGEAALIVYATTLISIMVTPIAKLQDLDIILTDKRITGLLIGPGASVSEETRTRVLAMLKSGKPTVLDAGALSSFKEDPQLLFSAIDGVCVLTPHQGEFSRVFPNIDPNSDKLSRARNAAKISGAIVVLKGNDTVIAAPDGRTIINKNAPATLATAGTGDVLAGIILGLLTQGMEPFLATAAAVWLHSEAAADFGHGLLAEDLPDQLPAVLQQLY